MKVYIGSPNSYNPEDDIRMSDAIIDPEFEDANVLYGPFDTTEDMWRSIFDNED